MNLDNEFQGLNPRRYKIPGFIGREQLGDLYGIGYTALTNSLKEIEPNIKDILPHFKLKNKRRFSIKEQELIFDLLGAPPGYEI